jgi:hypothetical protein
MQTLMDASKCPHHVRLPDPGQTRVLHSDIPGPICCRVGLRGTRVHLSRQMILALAFFALISPATASDDESYSLSYASRTRHHGHLTPMAFCLAMLLLIGHKFGSWFTALVEPLMGIISVLWLMMRNDAAISPKASWM